MPNIEEPLKTKRESGLFRFIKKMAQSEINRATKNRESVKKHIRLELTPPVADFVSAPSGRLRSLSPPSLAAFPGNCSKPSQFPGAHSASWFKILCPLNKKTAHIFMHGTILSRLSDLNPPKIEEPLKTGLRQRASLGSSI